ncbi:MAG: hypothetical protein ABSB91_02985 [Sedimentisphaerales bacterium]
MAGWIESPLLQDSNKPIAILEIKKMLGKLITVVVVVMLTIAGFGCKKKPAPPAAPGQPAAPKTEVKSQAEYNEMAKKQITKDNMQTELDKVEKEVQQEGLR